MDPASALLLGTTALGIGTSAAQARQQNQATRASQQEAARANAIQREQLREQADQQRRQSLRDIALASGAARASAANRGVGLVNIASIERANQLIGQENLDTIGINLSNQIASLNSQTRAQQIQLNANLRDPIFAGVAGGLTGLSTGLGIREGLDL